MSSDAINADRARDRIAHRTLAGEQLAQRLACDPQVFQVRVDRFGQSASTVRRAETESLRPAESQAARGLVCVQPPRRGRDFQLLPWPLNPQRDRLSLVIANELADLLGAFHRLAIDRDVFDLRRCNPASDAGLFGLDVAHDDRQVSVVRKKVEDPIVSPSSVRGVGLMVSLTRWPLRSTSSGRSLARRKQSVIRNCSPRRIFACRQRRRCDHPA